MRFKSVVVGEKLGEGFEDTKPDCSLGSGWQLHAIHSSSGEMPNYKLIKTIPEW